MRKPSAFDADRPEDLDRLTHATPLGTPARRPRPLRKGDDRSFCDARIDPAAQQARASAARCTNGVRVSSATRFRRHAELTANADVLVIQREASRSGRISAIPTAPPISITTPQIMNPVLKPASGVAAFSITLPIT